MLSILKTFFAKVHDSKKGILIPEELFRSILTALGSGSILSLALSVLQSILASVALIFPDPTMAGLATVSLTLITDLIRRLGQGDQPTPTPAAPVAPVVHITPVAPITPVRMV